MKKIFTLIAVAAMAMTANAQGIAWAFDADPKADAVISDDNFASGTVTITGQDETYQEGAGFRVQKPSAGDNAGISFLTFAPLDVDEGVTVEWKANVAAGKSVTPKNISLRMARFGTDGGLVTVSYSIDGGEPVVLAEGLIPARNNKSKDEDAKGGEDNYTDLFSARLRDISAATSSFAIIAKWTGLATNKQIGYSQIAIQTGDEIPSSIQNIETTKAYNAAIYNLAGQKVANDYKGLVIKNGRKFIQK